MPDRSDVEAALAAAIAKIVYPDGSDEDSAAGVDCRVYRGWPVPRVLESELRQGVAHVTVQPVAGTVRDRTRYPDEWQGSTPTPTLTVLADGDTVSFSGVGGPGHVVGVRVDGRPYAYRMRSGDTAALVAAALAAMIRNDRPAIAAGTVIQVNQATGLIARVVTDGIGGRELRRQSADFRVTFWCPEPNSRDRLTGTVDAGVAALNFLETDGWACRIKLTADSSTDEGSAGGVWRRDLVFSVEYPTTINETLPAMLFGIVDVNDVPFIG